MPAPLKVLAVTGSRADWNYLVPPLAIMRDDPAFKLQLAITGQHLVPEGADSLKAIAADGFHAAARIDMLLAADTAVSVTKSLGLAVIGFADVIARFSPDLLFVHGDRYEILGAVQAALIARVPVAHLAGGDLTLGAFDEAIRHSITKMSHLHFVTNAEAETRVRQLGENPLHIYNVGSSGLDRIRTIVPMTRAEFFGSIAFEARQRTAFVTFHPVTLESSSVRQCKELLAALDFLGSDIGLIFTGVNADPDGRLIETIIRDFVAKHHNAILVPSLGSNRYLSGLAHVDVVIGNSSSGLYEAPSFQIPTVNIGNRQAGRMRAASVVDCEPERNAILAAIRQAFVLDCANVVNPYGDGHASERIVAALRNINNPEALLKKRFFSLQ